MCKKILISFVLVTLINFLVSCYSSELITASEYYNIKKADRPDSIRVITTDFNEYNFSHSSFYIRNDTLYGKASFIGELPFEGTFALGEIESIQIGSFYVTVSGFQKMEAKSGKPDEIYLTKYDSKRYHFMKDDYFTKNDTLYGKGKLILDERISERNVALSEIETIEFESRNWLTTSLLLLGVSLILLIVLAIASVASNPPKIGTL